MITNLFLSYFIKFFCLTLLIYAVVTPTQIVKFYSLRKYLGIFSNKHYSYSRIIFGNNLLPPIRFIFIQGAKIFFGLLALIQMPFANSLIKYYFKESDIFVDNYSMLIFLISIFIYKMIELYEQVYIIIEIPRYVIAREFNNLLSIILMFSVIVLTTYWKYGTLSFAQLVNPSKIDSAFSHISYVIILMWIIKPNFYKSKIFIYDFFSNISHSVFITAIYTAYIYIFWGGDSYITFNIFENNLEIISPYLSVLSLIIKIILFRLLFNLTLFLPKFQLGVFEKLTWFVVPILGFCEVVLTMWGAHGV